MVDSVLTKVEQQFDQQDQQVSSMISQKKEKADSQLKDADLLLRNVKGAFQVQQDNIGQSEDKIIREIQLLLLNDKTQWQQVKQQIVFRLNKLKDMGEVSDFAEPLNDIAERLTVEQSERKKDDQEIIDLLNNVCTKMYSRFQQQ